MRSLAMALAKLGRDYRLVSDGESLMTHDFSRVLIPGVGSIRHAMQNLEQRGLSDGLRQRYSQGLPILGICLGMQLLFSFSEEDGGVEGLNFIDGRVRQTSVSSGGPVSRVGWDSVRFKTESSLSGEYFFAHAYEVVPADERVIAAVASRDNRNDIVAAVAFENLVGMQFHPEKSSKLGLRCLDWAFRQS